MVIDTRESPEPQQTSLNESLAFQIQHPNSHIKTKMPGRGRGRGRWRGRGRGGGTNQGGRGQQSDQDTDVWNLTETATSDQDFEKRPELLFTSSKVTFDQHLAAQESYKNVYLATMKVLLANGVSVSQGIKVRALAVAWARKDHALAETFLQDSETFTMAEILKALNLLDAGRRMREKERHLRQLQVQIQEKVKVNPKKMSKVKSDIDNFNATKPKVGSVSGALSRHIRRWVRSLTSAQLEFYALHYPKEPWKTLADICHLNPKKDFPEKPWFLPYCFGEPAPSESLVAKCAGMNAENINELVKGVDVPYTHIKQFTVNLTEESKERIATYEEKVDTLLWYYEDLHCPKVDEVICRRISDGEAVTLPSGKLIERLLLMKTQGIGSCVMESLIPEAAKRLKTMKVSLEAPVAILGDRSPSMDIAIKTSTIIAGLLTAITDAKLSFFSNKDYVPEKIPKTITEILKMASTLKTHGSTAPAASLWPYYECKEVIKTFVVVTDEEENCDNNGYRFQALFKKYREEVYSDAKLVFISFLRSQHAPGQMVSLLTADGIHPMQFKFSRDRPDLTKLDSVLGLLSTSTGDFKKKVDRIAQEMTDAQRQAEP
eukprot:XP_011673366.1 PREDICTED: uncharacterized protein LOC579550 isoform X1 [Strongylocentrotus purpuratus]